MITIKNNSELEKMRKAGIVVRDVLLLLEESIKIGMSTKELDKIAFDFITRCGAIPSFLGYGGFPASTCISIDEVVIHGIPTEDRIIRDGEIVSVDVGAILDGYQGDAARSFLMGNVTEEKKKLVEVTKSSFFKGIEGLKAGSSIGDIGYRIQTYAESNGYSVVRTFVGHGIGREMHEDPSVPNYGREGTGIRLKAGMTIAIEPMINMGVKEVEVMRDGWTVKTKDRKPSAHYENTVAILDDGVEILTL